MPPVRDEESEVQRKAHSKRIRETRRSTQGVTLEEIKSAQQYNLQQAQQKELNNVKSPSVQDSPRPKTLDRVPQVILNKVLIKNSGCELLKQDCQGSICKIF